MLGRSNTSTCRGCRSWLGRRNRRHALRPALRPTIVGPMAPGPKHCILRPPSSRARRKLYMMSTSRFQAQRYQHMNEKEPPTMRLCDYGAQYWPSWVRLSETSNALDIPISRSSEPTPLARVNTHSPCRSAFTLANRIHRRGAADTSGSDPALKARVLFGYSYHT